jgi:hypothetical protein
VREEKSVKEETEVKSTQRARENVGGKENRERIQRTYVKEYAV